jgi:curved DNA-binding protein CbpA
MASDYLDYYDILGVPPRAAAGDIKKAYRQLAFKWHPDKNPGDPWATSRFLRLGEAYRVLMDPVCRAAYDWLRSQENHRREISPRSRWRPGRKPGASPLHSTSRRPPRPTYPGRQPSRSTSRVRGWPRRRPSPVPHTEELSGSPGGFFPWLLSFKDLPRRLLDWIAGRPPAHLEWEMVPTPGLPDLIMDLKVPRWMAARGARVTLLIRADGQQRRLRVTIPPGALDGLCLRLKGAGRSVGSIRGHLYVNIRLLKD